MTENHATLDDLRKASNRLDAIEFAFYKYPASFERFFMAHPLPSWVKRADGVMVLSNRAYETAYDIPPLEYAGALDGDVWGDEGEDFNYLDQIVVEQDKPALGVEWITLPASGKKQALFVNKWPVRWDDEGRPTHIAGSVLGAVTVNGGSFANVGER